MYICELKIVLKNGCHRNDGFIFPWDLGVIFLGILTFKILRFQKNFFLNLGLKGVIEICREGHKWIRVPGSIKTHYYLSTCLVHFCFFLCNLFNCISLWIYLSILPIYWFIFRRHDYNNKGIFFTRVFIFIMWITVFAQYLHSCIYNTKNKRHFQPYLLTRLSNNKQPT